MHIDSNKSPLEGAVPTNSENELPTSDSQASKPMTVVSASADMKRDSENQSTGKLSNTDFSNHYYHHHHHHQGNTTTPSRSFVNRKKLICRCPKGILCVRDIHQARGSHRAASNSSVTPLQLNIPVEGDTTRRVYPNTVPNPNRVSEAVPTWVPQVNDSSAPSNAQTSAKPQLILRGVNPLLQQQMQHHKKISQIPTSYRTRAIDYMMTHLHLRGGENEKGLEAVRRRIHRLEEQAFSAAVDKDNYVQLLALKLGAIMESLYSCRNNRLSLSQPHAAATHPQPTCG